MTTSYQHKAVKELREKKKKERALEVKARNAKNIDDEKSHQENMKRIAAKELRIANGEPAPEPKSVEKIKEPVLTEKKIEEPVIESEIKEI